MAKVYDITDKLSFDEEPVIVIKGKRIEVNNEASSVLEMFSKMGNKDELDADTINEMTDLLFTKQGKKVLNSLGLNMDDYSKVIDFATDLVMGENEEPGELPSDGTISSPTGI